MSHPTLHRKALIVGLGKTGVSAARHFVERGWHIAVTDTRVAPPGREQLAALAPKAECSFGRLDHSLLEGSEIVVASPGIALREPLIAEALARGIEVDLRGEVGDSGEGPFWGVRAGVGVDLGSGWTLRADASALQDSTSLGRALGDGRELADRAGFWLGLSKAF